MIQYRTEKEQNTARNAAFYLLDQTTTKDMLSKKVCIRFVLPAKLCFQILELLEDVQPDKNWIYEMLEDTPFAYSFQNSMLNILNWHCNLTFLSEINDFICLKISRLFAWLLAKLDTNHNLATFPAIPRDKFTDAHRESMQIWLSILTSWTPLNITGWDKITLFSVEVSYESKFPFSFAIFPRFQSLKQSAETLAKRYDFMCVLYAH